MPRYLFIRRRRWWPRLLLSLALLTGIVGVFLLNDSQQQATSLAMSGDTLSGPPWIYGNSAARFTLVTFADFECPYCQAMIPRLLRWVQKTPDVALQWHHLPLPDHEPMASYEARLAECQGAVYGTTAFWETVTWIYLHTRGEGRGPATAPTNLSATVQACLDSEQTAAIVLEQASEAAADGIAATPTLQLLDQKSGRSLKLEGVVDDDVLLSALDWLSSTHEPADP